MHNQSHAHYLSMSTLIVYSKFLKNDLKKPNKGEQKILRLVCLLLQGKML